MRDGQTNWTKIKNYSIRLSDPYYPPTVGLISTDGHLAGRIIGGKKRKDHLVT
jgi:hypothetical protein